MFDILGRIVGEYWERGAAVLGVVWLARSEYRISQIEKKNTVPPELCAVYREAVQSFLEARLSVGANEFSQIHSSMNELKEEMRMLTSLILEGKMNIPTKKPPDQ